MDESECRTCLKKGASISIFSKYEDISNAEMLTACATVSISPEDNYSKQLCLECKEKLGIAYSFRRLCEASYEYLTKACKESIKKEKDDIYECENGSTDVNCGWIKLEDDKSNYDEEIVVETLPEINETHSSRKVVKKGAKKRKVKSEGNKIKEKKSAESDKSKKLHQCSYCPKVLTRKHKLILHEDVHLGIKRYFCDICQKNFRSGEQHKRLHRYGFKYKCEHCEKVFNTDQKLKQHVLVHDTNRKKSYVCEVEGCGRSYLSSTALYTHRKRNHSQENGKLVCEICSKVLGSDHALKEHMARHASKKQFKCSHCEREFFTRHSLRCHEMYHTEKKFTCDQCDKQFIFKHMLLRHMKLHQEYTECCRFCDKKFARPDYIKRHERKEHEMELSLCK